MSCTHITHCPLFPYLNKSLGSWRDAYCDSTDNWDSCARYQLSQAGEPVPLALLPNGKLPVAMIPNLSRAEAAEVVVAMGSCGPANPSPQDALPPELTKVAQDRLVPGEDTDQLFPGPGPAERHVRGQARRAWLAHYIDTIRRHTVAADRWVRILDWLRAPA